MVRLLRALLALIPAVAAAATPLSAAEAQPDHNVTAAACAFNCGTACYQDSDIYSAVSMGYSLYRAGDDINDYPHEYHNYEGFDLPGPGPWYEYPIMADHDVYEGGSPGPDRVVFDGDGALGLLITHTGAGGDAFVACRTGY